MFEPEHAVDASAIPVDVNETTVIRLSLPSPLQPSGKLKMERCYATETAVASHGESQTFSIKVEDSDKVESARLMVGIHRGGGITEPLAVDMNSTPVTIDTGDANEFTEFFAPLDASVPTSVLQDENKIVIKAQKGATITSVQIVTFSPVD